ncbi:10714_t:CDS:2 [Cetraspora pellucida]|uniref:10714_t:CDS:1 n=1 Tax=Cetraspora pellucida TaxID=1433469 RepID=A0A9N8W125_9GLOM|nr:10714_t:CDS:2 [Cetraspora pellucida]
MSKKSISDKKEVKAHPSTRSKFFPISVVILIISIVIYILLSVGHFTSLQCRLLRIGCLNTKVQGYVAPEFIDVEKTFIKNFENGYEVGANVAAYYNGKLVVDLHGGYADLETMREYDNNTLQFVFSSTKVMSSIVIAYLVDRGILDYNEKISTYWPEFAQGNKENVTLLDLVNHRAGVNYLDNMSDSDFEDLDKLAKVLAAQPHSFDGVPNRAYHAVTRGWYLNEVVRRVDPKHRTIGKIVSEEILTQYDLEFYISLPPSHISRVAKFYKPKSWNIKRVFNMLEALWNKKMSTSDVWELITDKRKMSKIFAIPGISDLADAIKLESITKEHPSVNGITNAKSIAKMGAMIVNNGQPLNTDSSKPFLSKSTVDFISTKLPVAFDHVILANFTPAAGGFAYFRLPEIEDVEFLGWGGYGGSLFLWNRELGISFGYVMNGLWAPVHGEIADKRGWSLLIDVVNAVKKLKKMQA